MIGTWLGNFGSREPHHGTLCRPLASIEPEGIEAAQVGLVRSLIRDRKSSHHLVGRSYMIGIDGRQKMVRRLLPDDPWLERKVGAEGKKLTQYYVYVLEANPVLSGGVSIPLMSEFLDYHKGDSEREKQDSELPAFFRLSERLKKALPHLPIMVLLDGLIARGPVMSRCRDYIWHSMIALQDGRLPHVWQEYQGLRRLLTEQDQLSQRWGNRQQHSELVNDIEYRHGESARNRLTTHLGACQESWKEVDREGDLVQRCSEWAWISDLPFSRATVHVRCTLGGPRRWCIEEDMLVEKQQDCNYEPCYAENWNAMRGYHYLMRIGHLLNVLASYCTRLRGVLKKGRGTQGFVDWVSNTLSGRWLDPAEMQPSLTAAFQLRLLFPVPQLPVLIG